MGREHYPAIGAMFVYPGADFAARVEAVQQLLDHEYPAAGQQLRPFTEAILGLSRRQLEELFTRSFDVQSVTTLDVGYVMFGDDYKRGELLAHLNAEHEAVGVDCGTELADHLPNLLCLIPRLSDEDLVQDLVGEIIYPALNVMIAEFEPTRVERRNAMYKKHFKTLIEQSEQATIYQLTLLAIRTVFETDFELVGKVTSIQGSEFLRTVNNELTVERFDNL